MPGFATGSESKTHALALMQALRTSWQELDIRTTATQMLKDIGHPFGKGEKVYDVTDGKGGITWRYSRKAAPMRLTLVNGEATFRDGAYTGAKPGAFLEPATEEARVAVAAE